MLLVDAGQLLLELLASVLLFGEGLTGYPGILGGLPIVLGVEPPAVGSPASCSTAHQHGKSAGGGGRQAELHRDQVKQAHASTSCPVRHRAMRSAWPVVPPLIRRVIASNWPASARGLRPLRDQNQAADSAAHSGCSSSSG